VARGCDQDGNAGEPRAHLEQPRRAPGWRGPDRGEADEGGRGEQGQRQAKVAVEGHAAMVLGARTRAVIQQVAMLLPAVERAPASQPG
jgi:hypothetical protein